jgi:hypothetical protein
LFFVGTGFELDFTLAKQVLYRLSRTSVHFALVILEMGSRELSACVLNLHSPDLSLASS